MKTSCFAFIALAVALSSQSGLGQSTSPAPAHKHTAAKPASQVDSVIQFVKGGMSEDLIIKSLKKTNKPVDLSPADMVKLKKAGVSDNIISVMLDPSSTPAPAAAAPPPASCGATTVRAATPIRAHGPASAPPRPTLP